MKLKLVSVVVASVLASASVPFAGASSVIGSTEPTQIANNVELVLSYAKQVEAVATQVKQYQAQLLSLRQMDPSKLAGMLKGVTGLDGVDDLMRSYNSAKEINTRLQSLSKSMETIYTEGKMTADVMANLHAKGIDLTGGQYAAAFKELAKQRQGDYDTRLKNFDAALDTAKSDIQRVNAIADTAPEIKTNVEGFGAIVQTNAIMSGQLAGLQQSLVNLGTMTTENAKIVAAQYDAAEQAKLKQGEWAKEWLMQSPDAGK